MGTVRGLLPYGTKVGMSNPPPIPEERKRMPAADLGTLSLVVIAICNVILTIHFVH